MPNTNIEKDILQLAEADLYEMIGDEVAGRQVFPLTREELIERGRAWWRAHLDQIRSVVCPHARELIAETDSWSALIAIADLLAGIIFHVAPVKVAALVVKAGIRKLCENDK